MSIKLNKLLQVNDNNKVNLYSMLYVLCIGNTMFMLAYVTTIIDLVVCEQPECSLTVI